MGTSAFVVGIIPLAVLIGFSLIFFFPFRRLFWRAGMNKNLAFIAFVPVLGIFILLGVAAFSTWPNEPGGYR